MRIALGIEYDGSQFHGWQVQPDLRTVQGELQKALSKIACTSVSVFCAGRTDTSVHATGQVVHFDTEAERPQRAWIFGSNNHLPHDISVRWAKMVDDTFHARFSALSRRYCYVIYNNTIRNCMLRTYLTWNYRLLDSEKMHEAAQRLLGEHDFSSFRALDCQSKSPMRRIESFTVRRQGDLVIIDVTANAFLHHMVRNMVGVLITIGSGRRQVEWVDDVLEAKNRAFAAETAPPYGLYLTEVNYPQTYGLPTVRHDAFLFGGLGGVLGASKND